MSSKAKIGLLLAVHVVSELLLAWAAWRIATRTPYLTAIPIVYFGLIALVIAEAGLVGTWGGLSSTRRIWRIPAVVAATLYLWAIYITPFPRNNRICFINALTLWTILVVLSGLRHSRRKLRLTNLAKESVASEGFQFSIRHLLLATAAVAVVLGIGRGMPTGISGRSRDILAVAIFTPCLIMVELATLWAALGTGRPTVRLAVVVPTAFAVGMIPTFLIRDPGNERRALLFWSVVVGLQAIISAVSLLVVRSCGWRMVSGATNTAMPAPEPTRRFRFTLKQLFLLVTLVGVGFGTWHWLTRKIVVVRAATAEDEELFVDYMEGVENADLNHKRNVAVATGRFTWLWASLYLVQAGDVEHVSEQEVGTSWEEGPMWQAMTCGISLGEVNVVGGQMTELTMNCNTGEGSYFPEDDEVVHHNITPVAKHTLPGTITPGRTHIVYVEGDQEINVDGTMTVEEFAKANPGNYLVVTVETR